MKKDGNIYFWDKLFCVVPERYAEDGQDDVGQGQVGDVQVRHRL